MATQKIAVYSIPDLKNTTDDALPNYLKSLKFKHSHYLSHVRLVLGYSAVVIAAVTFAVDYKLGWDATKAGTFWAVLMYFLLNGALTFWIWQVEKGVVFVGEKNGARISLATSATKYKPVYNVKVTQRRPGEQQDTVIETSAPFRLWFDADGYFVAKPFQQWLASVVPVIGEADSKNSGAAVVETPKGESIGVVQDTATPTNKKRGRPRKD